MKFSAITLSLCVASAAAAASPRYATKDFIRAMEEPGMKATRRKSQANKVRELNESLMKASRKLQNNQYNYNWNQGGDANQAGADQNNQWYNYDYNGDWDQDGVADGYWLDGIYYPYEEAPFDMTARAFKYSGCAAIKSYDVDRAQEYGNPMVMDTYAVFRLCPADKCNHYSMTGCNKNYGEYAVEMKTYLSYVLGYYDDRYEEYCGYCEPCDWQYQATSKSSLNQCYSQMTKWQQMQAYNQNQAANSMQQQATDNAASANQAANYNKYYYGNNPNQYQDDADANAEDADANAEAEDADADNADADNGADAEADNGERKLEQAADYNNGQNAYYSQGNQQANAYGYYDDNGDWIDGENGAGAQFGYWGADGNFYPYNQDINYNQVFTCKDGSSCDYCVYQNEKSYNYCDNYICGDYYTYCSDLYKNEQQQEFDPLDYLECTAWENQAGEIYYIAPHCGSDHYTVSLGVFEDENCLEYIGEDVTLSTVLGFQFDDEDVLKIPKDCISCDGAEDYAEQQEASYQEYYESQAQQEALYEEYQEYVQTQGQQQANYNYQQQEDQEYYASFEEYAEARGGQQQGNQYYGQGVYGSYVTSPQTTQDGVVAMCSALYSGSAQCNMNMQNFEQISRYMSQYELDIENRYCSFIENIIFGAYDESGEILLRPESFDFNDWRNPKQYKTLRMAPGQAIGLSLSIVLCIALLAAAAVTNRSLTRSKSPWKPQRSDVSVSRQNSGIVLGRSRSGPGAAPLI